MLAAKSLNADNRVLLVSQDEALCAALSEGLWAYEATSFLAHDFVGSENEAGQPILISDKCDAVNAAKYVVLADGKWRDSALDFDRAFYLFTPEQIDGARNAWRALAQKGDVTPRYWKQDGGRWVDGP